MGGLFGVVSGENKVTDLYYGTDYHSHLGTSYGGLSTKFSNDLHITSVRDISSASFRSQFVKAMLRFEEVASLEKIELPFTGIGAISDYDKQPLAIHSKHGKFSIATVGKINKPEQLYEWCGSPQISRMDDGEMSPTELIAAVICHADTIRAGIEVIHEHIRVTMSSCSFILLTNKGIIAVRDYFDRTPLVIGKNDKSFAVTSETCALHNLGYEIFQYLKPSEAVFITVDKIETLREPFHKQPTQICSFLWVYYGYPASDYEGINVEAYRYRSGAALAKADLKENYIYIDYIDSVAGIPDSGVGHAISYANKISIPYNRPFVKHTPSWPRSFMPPNQSMRDLIAKRKLIPIKELIKNK